MPAEWKFAAPQKSSRERDDDSAYTKESKMHPPVRHLLTLTIVLLLLPKALNTVAQSPPPQGLSGVWTDGDSSKTLLTNHVLGAAAPLPNGGVIAAGGLAPGLQGAAAVALAEIYDPVDAKWKVVTPMSIGRWSLDAIAMKNNKVLFAGGASAFSESAVLDSAELFDSASMLFIPVENKMSAARHSYGISMLTDGRVLLTGGSTKGNSLNGSGTTSTDLYDPETNRFSPAAPLRDGRALHAQVTLKDGRVVVIGGAQRNAEIYDPASNRWTTFPGLLPTTLKDMKAFETFDHRIFVAGGQNTQDGLTTDDTWFLGIESGKFTPGPTMQGFNYSPDGPQKGSSDYSAFDLFPSDHKFSGRYFFFAGGENDPPTGADVELNSSCLFDVANNKFVDLGPMPFIHDDHTEAMTGLNGKGHPEVLLFGGNSSSGTSRFEFLTESISSPVTSE